MIELIPISYQLKIRIKSYKLWILCNCGRLGLLCYTVQYNYVLAYGQFCYCKYAASNPLNVFFNLQFEMKTLIVRAQKKCEYLVVASKISIGYKRDNILYSCSYLMIVNSKLSQ